MRQRLLSGLCVWILILSARAETAEKKVRVDIVAPDTGDAQSLEIGEVSAGGKAAYAGWMESSDGTHRGISAHWNAGKNWRTGSITFTPLASGKVILVILGPYVLLEESSKLLDPVQAWFDNITSEQTNILNGDFEGSEKDGVPKGWFLNEVRDSNPPIDESTRARVVKGGAADETHFVKVWHYSRFSQGIPVEAGVPVTITFSYRIE